VSNKFFEFTSLSRISEAMQVNGVTRLYVKKLAPNDNSKNQVYLGGSFDVLNIIPFGKITVDINRRISKRDRFKSNMKLCWINSKGRVSAAPQAQLILYPKYPEVRMSGFLKGCVDAPSEAMANRYENRLLFLGIKPDGTMLAHATLPSNPIYREIEVSALEERGVFLDIPLGIDNITESNRQQLINILKSIHARGWLDSIRLNSSGEFIPCHAMQCGGYTLEALLGVKPNGYAEPDFMGWEVKQHGVRNLEKPLSGGPITIMTPEPTGGLYKEGGVDEFIRTYGYEDRRGIPDRLNFGGIYKVGKTTEITGLKTSLVGFDLETGKLDKIDGGLYLLDPNDEPAATWSFAALLELWNRKHAKAVYIPSKLRLEPQRQYRYGHLIELGEGTNFMRFITAMAHGHIYLDPALKIENASSSRPRIKRRNQFRIKPRELPKLYESFEQVNLSEII
jgi:hypothetical protein